MTELVEYMTAWMTKDVEYIECVDHYENFLELIPSNSIFI